MDSLPQDAFEEIFSGSKVAEGFPLESDVVHLIWRNGYEYAVPGYRDSLITFPADKINDTSTQEIRCRKTIPGVIFHARRIH